jgi:hypothetical protein
LAALTSLAFSAATLSPMPPAVDESSLFEMISSRNASRDQSAKVPGARPKLPADQVKISRSRVCRFQSPLILIWISFSTCLTVQLASIQHPARLPVPLFPTISVVALSLSAFRCRTMVAIQDAISAFTASASIVNLPLRPSPLLLRPAASQVALPV